MTGRRLISCLDALRMDSNELSLQLSGGVAEWLRRSVSNHVRSTRMGSNPVVGTTNHKPTVNSVVHPSEVGK